VVTRTALPPDPRVHVYRNLGPNSAGLLHLFAEADLFVLPSYAECLSVALLEAAASGLPVVTTNVGALAEAVVPGESGLLIPPGDRVALESALERLASDAPLRQRMGRAGHALAQRKFDAERNNQALLDLLVEIARVN
jgi:glycosyltransferase involved in cell wall biosynthesis